jgi:hypothetical protein
LIADIEPGEWIAIISAFGGLAVMLQCASYAAVALWYGTSTAVDWSMWFVIPNFCLEFAWLILLSRLIWAWIETFLWLVSFLLLNIRIISGWVVRFLLVATDPSSYIDALGTFQEWIWAITQFMLVASVSAAFAQDLYQRRNRRWTHWSGAGLFVIETVVNSS